MGLDAPENTDYTVKEVIQDLKGDLVHRFDKMDTRLESIDNRLDNTATKEDVAVVHKRIDDLSGDLNPRVSALETSQSHRRINWKVASAIGGILAVLATAIIPHFL